MKIIEELEKLLNKKSRLEEKIRKVEKAIYEADNGNILEFVKNNVGKTIKINDTYYKILDFGDNCVKVNMFNIRESEEDVYWSLDFADLTLTELFYRADNHKTVERKEINGIIRSVIHRLTEALHEDERSIL